MMGIEARNVWQWLDEKSWLYMPFFDGWRSPDGKFFICTWALYRYPGDVIDYLKTGYIRNIHIFDNGLSSPTPESLGLKAHKDGRCVQMVRVK